MGSYGPPPHSVRPCGGSAVPVVVVVVVVVEIVHPLVGRPRHPPVDMPVPVQGRVAGVALVVLVEEEEEGAVATILMDVE